MTTATATIPNPNGTAFDHIGDRRLADEIAEANHAIKTISRRIGSATTGTGPAYDGNDVAALGRWKTYLTALRREQDWREGRG